MVRHSLAMGCLVAVLVSAGCSSGETPPAEEVESTESAVTLATPKPIASLPLKNGNVVEFYEFERGALVSERGAASGSPALDGKGKDARDLASTWTALAPNVAVPARLVDLQKRLSNLPAESAEPKKPLIRESGGTPHASAKGTGRITPDALACNNGCCDPSWLLSQTYCAPGSGMDATWFLFNYGYDYANYDDIMTYRAIVCAAIGTSTYTVSIDGVGGTWAVPEATYRTYFWFAGHSVWCGGICDEDMTSGVNQGYPANMHTYCGGVNFD